MTKRDLTLIACKRKSMLNYFSKPSCTSSMDPTSCVPRPIDGLCVPSAVPFSTFLLWSIAQSDPKIAFMSASVHHEICAMQRFYKVQSGNAPIHKMWISEQ